MANRKVGIGVIGAGGIARRRTIPGLLKAKNCQLVAVMDPVGVEEIAAQFKVPAAYTTEKDLLADPAVEAVYIASPLGLHAQQIKMAAAAGKHILCEKPLTLNLKQGEAVVDICKKAGVYLQEGYMMRFHGAHQRMKELIDDGCIGKVVSMRAQLSCWYPKIEGAWRQDPRQGGAGGALVDMATHLIDLMTMFAGPVRRVGALLGNLVQQYKPADATTTLLEFRSGAHGTVDCFFCIPDEASRTRLEVYGSQGALLSEGTIGQSTGGKLEGVFTASDQGYDAAQTKDVVRKFQPIKYPKVNPYTAECEYFAQCILDRRAPKINDGKNALTIQRIVEQALQSKKTKTILPV